jgi:5-(carboxyamino)imidazole ribonucleotide mutase
VTPVVSVVMGSISDWSVMEHAASTLADLGIPYETRIISAHRMPVEMAEFAEAASDRGFRVIVAGAGGAAHLPGMIAAHTLVPVLGVPVPSTALQGTDSLLSIVQMPAGVPVATFAVGRAGAVNAALFAASVLAGTDDRLAERLAARRQAAHDAAVASQAELPAQADLPAQAELPQL